LTYGGHVAFTLPRTAAQPDPEVRARAATAALASALEASAPALPNAPLTSIVVEEGVGLVRVRGYLVLTVTLADAVAAGFPDLPSYGRHLESALETFLPNHLGRGPLHQWLLHVFLAAFLLLAGFVFLGQTRALFLRWEHRLDQRKETLAALTVLRVPILSREAVGGLLALGVTAGRWLAYVAVSVTTVSVVLAQFDATASLMGRSWEWAGTLALRGFQTGMGVVPGLVLAGLLLLVVDVALRVVAMVLESVTRRPLEWPALTPGRVVPTRAALSAAIVLLAAPLVIGAAFGRFGTPLETLALCMGGAVFLGAVPVLASVCVGVVVLWRESLAPGDWVQVGPHAGEVTSLGLLELKLVPEAGGVIAVPMLYLLWNPLMRLGGPPVVSVEVCLRRDRPPREVMEAVRRAVKGVAGEARATCQGLTADRVMVCVTAPAGSRDLGESLLLAMGDASDRGELTLADPAPRTPPLT
jgi:hypothetical protein